MAAYALRPMSTGEILDGALTLLRRHFGLLCGLAIVCQGLVGQVFTAGLASGLVTLLATLGLVIPGIVVYCGYSVVLQVAVLEPRGSSGALGRSWDLTKGYKWKALGLWAVSLALLIVLFAGTTAIGAVAEQVQAVQVTSAVLSAGAQLLIYPLIGCVFTLFYYDLRIRKEGFDLEVLSQSLSS